MNIREFSEFEKITKKRLALIAALAFCFTIAAGGQSEKQKKLTCDFSETVKYFDTPLEAGTSCVKEKYPCDNYEASAEATNDAEMFRCSAGDAYIGIVYQRDRGAGCDKTSPAVGFRTLIQPAKSFFTGREEKI